MGIYEYLIMSDEDQWDVIWDKTVCITNLKLIDAKFQLRALDQLFIELEFCISTDRILSKNVFVTGSRLEKYIDDLGYYEWLKSVE